MTGPHAPDDFDLRRADQLRGVLHRAGFTEATLADALGPHRSGNPLDWPVLERRLADPTPLHRLCRLFVLGRPLPRAEADDALGAGLVGELTAAGLLQSDGDRVLARVSIAPFRDLLCVSDFPPATGGGDPPEDHVPGPGPVSASLADLTVRRPVESALDVGTGCGVQALLAAGHARHVIGTDINPRALRLADWAARLNGRTAAEWRTGSFFEPAAGRQFDLVVSNPPFVISPESRFVFRDSGLAGDGVSEQVVRNAAAHLREGGYATVLSNWHHRTDDDWAERPRAWVRDLGCDAWILRMQGADPLSYAANWLGQTDVPGSARYAERLDAWLAYYARAGMTAFSAGAFLLRRSSGRPNWVRCDWLPASRLSSACGDQIERIFANEDLLHRLTSEADWLALRFRVPNDHLLEHRLHLDPGGWQVTSSTLRPSQGLILGGHVDAGTVRLLAACDGSRGLREIVAELAGSPDRAQALVPSVLAAVRALLQSGLLVPA